MRFVASDGLRQASATTTILVNPVNQPPSLVRPADFTVREGEFVRIQLDPADADGDPIEFSSDLLPGGAFLDPNTGVFTWIPSFFQAGVFEISFSVSDAASTTTKTTRVTVLNVNASPEFDRLDGFELQEGQILSFRPFARDPDNPTFAPPDRLADGSLTLLDGGLPSVTYEVTGLPVGTAFDAETIEFGWTPDFLAAGLYHVTFTATDDGDGTGTPQSATVTVPILVRNTNRTPVITPIAAQTIDRGQVLEIPIEAVDPDGNALVLSAAGLPGFQIPDFMTFTDHGDGTGLLRVVPGFNARGDHSVTITAADNGDGGGNAAILRSNFTFVVSVNSPNEPPRIAHIGDKVAVLGEELQFTVRVGDLDEDDLHFSATGLPAGATLTPDVVYGTATFRWTPASGAVGTHPITVSVIDSGNGNSVQVLGDARTFNVVVRTANAAPVLAPIGDRQVLESKTLSVQLAAVDSDGDPLTYSATNLPPGAVLDPISGLLTWTPNLFQAGTYSGIGLSVSDGHRTSSESIAIIVANANQAPLVTPLPVQSGREGVLLQFTVSTSDIDGDPVALSVTDLPQGATFDTRSGQFLWTPGFEQAGEHVLTFTGEDPLAASGAIEVLLRIDNVNRAPGLNVGSHAVALGETLEFALEGSDPDLGTLLVYSAAGLPEGATLDPGTGLLEWTPGPGQAGDYTITYRVSDGELEAGKSAILRATIAPRRRACASS